MELLQIANVEAPEAREEADVVELMQRIGQPGTQLDWPRTETAAIANEHSFYQRLQRDLETIKLKHMIGAHVAQPLYYVRKMKIEGLIAMECIASVEALLLAYANENTDEASCRADECESMWHARLRAFIGQGP